MCFDDTICAGPKIIKIYDEPFADSSQIPTYLLSEFVKQQATVVLSGDGADEQLFGYGHYAQFSKLWRIINPLPNPIKTILSRILLTCPEQFLTKVCSPVNLLMKKSITGGRLHMLANCLQKENIQDAYDFMKSNCKYLDEVLKEPADVKTIFSRNNLVNKDISIEDQIMLFDITNYLPDDILTKVDRASMACSVETRIPLLDHRIVEFIFNLPFNMKSRHHHTKYILRQIVYKYIPQTLLDRPKMGFSIPLGIWLRGPLFEWANDLLSEEKLKRSNLLNNKAIQTLWLAHQKKEKNWASQLWSVLVFQAWYEDIFL